MVKDRKKRTGKRAGSFHPCVGCKKFKPRNQLVRFVRRSDGNLVPDTFGKIHGRGVHLCPNIACFSKARDERGLSRVFRASTGFEHCQDAAKQICRELQLKVFSLIGSALHSGLALNEQTAIEKARARGQVALLVIASDAPLVLAQAIQNKNRESRIPMIVLPTPNEPTGFLQQEKITFLAILHRGIARRLSTDVFRWCSLANSMVTGFQSDMMKLTLRPVREMISHQLTGGIVYRT